MKFGIGESDWTLLETMALKPLRAAGANVWIFGSRATGTFKKFSDIDLLYEFQGAVPQGLVGKIKLELEDSNLTLKVDLVNRLEVVTSYKDQIEAQKILL
jgi:predicted nucleotidyltransferase